MEEYKGIIKLNGKKYNVAVIDGKCFVEKILVDDFLSNLSQEDKIALCDLARLGKGIIKNQIESPQEVINEFYQSRNN